MRAWAAWLWDGLWVMALTDTYYNNNVIKGFVKSMAELPYHLRIERLGPLPLVNHFLNRLGGGGGSGTIRADP